MREVLPARFLVFAQDINHCIDRSHVCVCVLWWSTCWKEVTCWTESVWPQRDFHPCVQCVLVHDFLLQGVSYWEPNLCYLKISVKVSTAEQTEQVIVTDNKGEITHPLVSKTSILCALKSASETVNFGARHMLVKYCVFLLDKSNLLWGWKWETKWQKI